METDRLKYFCTITEAGSLTRASELLGISHSGLSKAMTVLQDELGLELLRPQGRGLELTEEGKRVYQKGKEILAQIDLLKNNKVKEEERFLRIGMTEALSLTLSRELARGSEILLDLYELDSGEIEVKILEGTIDFALTLVPFPRPDLEYLKIKKSSMGIFHLNQDFQTLPLSEIPFVIPNSGLSNNPLSIKSRDSWPMEVGRKISYGASTLSMALEIVQSGQAAIFIPAFLGEKLMLKEYETNEIKVPYRDIYLVKKKNIKESKEMKLLAKMVRRLC